MLAPEVVRPIWSAVPAVSVGGFTLTFGFRFFAQLSSLTMRCSISRTLVRYSSSLDGWAWLPNDKILFTGDACVNGPYNYAGDGTIGDWLKTLEAVKKLGGKTVCPGHGPVGGAELLDDQNAYFTALTDEVKKLTGKDPSEVKQSVEGIRETLKKQERIARYAGNFFLRRWRKFLSSWAASRFFRRRHPWMATPITASPKARPRSSAPAPSSAQMRHLSAPGNRIASRISGSAFQETRPGRFAQHLEKRPLKS